MLIRTFAFSALMGLVGTKAIAGAGFTLVDSVRNSLSVYTVPAEADVYLDGNLVGQTPFQTFDISYGTHRVEVRKFGFSAVIDTVQLLYGHHVARNFRLQRPGGLSVQSMPTGASVFLDDERAGVTPVDLVDLAPGSRRLRISTPEYHDWNQKIVVPESTTIIVNVKMVSKYGTVHIHLSPQDAELFIDGQRAGFGTTEQKLEVGRHTIEVRHPSTNYPATTSIYVGPGTEFYMGTEIGKTTFSPLLVSIPLPGVGQIMDGNPGEGLLIGLGTLALGMFTYTTSAAYDSRLAEYNAVRERYLNERNDEDRIVSYREDMLYQYDRLKRMHTLRVVTAGLLGVLYGYNLVDAFLNHRISHRIFVLDRESFLKMNPSLSEGRVSLLFTIGF
ncbi:MAG: PEGA domain-containing protein [Ignavibacteriales bacterium]|nr:PEGA domain-containing protein [Ignavibacteriales bacterium]